MLGLGASRGLRFERPELGLTAFLVLDSTVLGHAAGGIRTRAYNSPEEAALDAAALARAMTLKCAIAGLPSGGGKMVVVDRPELRRQEAFAYLGERIDELGGAFRTAGDLGTTREDLQAVASRTEYVSLDEAGLTAAVARGLRGCIEACARMRGLSELDGLRIAIQGCGGIGGAVARELATAGAKLMVSDIDDARAAALAADVKGEVVDPSEILAAAVDVLAPCAVGGVIGEDTAERISAWAICGAANNIVASRAAGEALRHNRILFVPDMIASAGAIVLGVCRDYEGLDPEPMIAALGDTAYTVMQDAERSGRTPQAMAEERARARIAAG